MGGKGGAGSWIEYDIIYKYQFFLYVIVQLNGLDQFHVTAAIMVQRSIGVKNGKQDVIAFVNTVTQFIHHGSYAHIRIVSVVGKFSWICWLGK